MNKLSIHIRVGRGSTLGDQETRDNLKMIYVDKLNNNQFPKKSISHKELNDFLRKAKKDISTTDNSENLEPKEVQEFNDLIKNWTETSQEILLLINKQKKVLTKNRNPKFLMAFGAMGAHINMALQALKSIESDYGD